MQKTLYALLELQEVDNRLDELEEERGDLPQIVEELKSKIGQKQTELSEVIEGLKDSKVKERELELTINEARQKFMRKYKLRKLSTVAFTGILARNPIKLPKMKNVSKKRRRA